MKHHVSTSDLSVKICIAVFFILILLPCAAFAQQENAVATVRRSARIYEELSPDSEHLGIARRGSTYEIIAVGKQWVQIDTKEGPGWIGARFVTIGDEAPQTLKEAGSPRFFIFLAAVFVAVIAGLIVFFKLKKDDEEFDYESI
jgi:hypothetical protein